MAEPMRYGDPWPLPDRPQPEFELTVEVPPPAPPFTPRASALSFVRELRERSQELAQPILREVTAAGAQTIREVRREAQDFRLRAEILHERRPIKAIGVAAGGAFAFGLILGLWRQ